MPARPPCGTPTASAWPPCCRSCASAGRRRAPTAIDPFALRALLLLGVFVLTVVVGDSAADRLWSAFRFSPLAKGAEARLDAWITPPSYTGKPPIMLADGGYHRAPRAGREPAGAMEVPGSRAR